MKKNSVLVLSWLLLAWSLGNEGRSSTSINGTPEEGDTVVSNIRNSFSSAQTLNRDALVDTYLGVTLNCKTYDARSYYDPDYGSNVRQFGMTIFRSNGPGYTIRFAGNGQTNFSAAAIDRYGFGYAASMGGHCLQARSVTYFRRHYDNTLLGESVQLDDCGNSIPYGTTPISRPGLSAPMYFWCEM